MDYLAINKRDFNAYYHDLQDEGRTGDIIQSEGNEWSLKGLTP